VILLVFLGTLFFGLALGVPVAFALMFCAIVMMSWMGIFNAQIVSQQMVTGANTFTLLAIPFFLLAGELMNAGGLSRRIVEFAVACVGHIRGGLGYVAVIAAVVMASLSGSAAADSAALAAILIPMMREAGYNVPRSAGLMAAGGVIAPVIPPSIAFIIFGVAANVSITALFLGGIVPGLMMALSLIAAWAIVSRRDNVATLPRRSGKERLAATVRASWALVMPVIILGGIRFGVFTPTEAAVVAAVYALFVGMVIYRELTIRSLYGVFLNAAKMTAVVLFLVSAALVTSWLITRANIPGEIAQFLSPVMDSPRLLMLVIVVLLLVVGMVLDLAPTILILSPVLMPVITVAGIDPVYFGIIFVMTCCIGLLTPPVGVVLNVVSGVARVPMGQVIVGVWPFLIAQVCVLFLLIAFPEIVLVPLVGASLEAHPSQSTHGRKDHDDPETDDDHGAGRGDGPAGDGAGQRPAPSRVSNGVAETHPVGNGVEAMRACITERTNGAWTLNAFWSGALGNDLDATQALRSGTQEMVITSTSPLVGIEPALGVFDLPFLFSNAAEADAVLDGAFGTMMSEKMDGVGPGEPGLVGKRLPQPDELGPPHHPKLEDFEGPARPRDAEQHLPRHVPDTGHERHADGLWRGVHRAGNQGDRRAGKTRSSPSTPRSSTRCRNTSRTRSTPTRRSWCCSRSRSSTPTRRKSSRSCATARSSAGTSSGPSAASCRTSRSRTSRRRG
jgi:TRAP-type transport system large permease protein